MQFSIRTLSRLFITVLLLSASAQSQDFVTQAQQGKNFFEICKEWHAKHAAEELRRKSIPKTQEVLERDSSLGPDSFDEMEGEEILFARWENYWKERVMPNGDFPSPQLVWDEWQKQKQRDRESRAKSANSVQQPTSWKFLGPTTKVPSGKGAGAGRVNCIRFNPLRADAMWIGTPGGGLWQSDNLGDTWTPMTDSFPSLGVADIAINPMDTNQIFLATGDMDGSNSMSFGVVKTDDRGKTWRKTSLSYLISQTAQMSRIIINPKNPNILLAGASNGLFRSVDNGETWKPVISGQIRDIEWKPNDPSVAYTCSGGAIWRSKDSGLSFTRLTTGITGSRVALGVTVANPEYVYALVSGSNNGFAGLYRSVDGGDTWKRMSSGTSINILNWSNDGVIDLNAESQGQGYYDLAIAVSPVDPNMILCGGVNIWMSTDGGATWEISAHWQGDDAPFVHADIHALEFSPEISSNELFAGTDGGVFESPDAGGSWADRSAGLGILQFYRIGTNPANPKMVLGGCQDNGTNLWNTDTWRHVYGADGMEAFFEGDNTYAYTTIYYGRLYRSQNNGTSFGREVSALGSRTGPWITPFILNPKLPSIIYCGTNSGIYRSDTRGDSWRIYSKSPILSTIALANPAADTARFYAATQSKVFTTDNSGANWKDISSGLKVGFISNIAADPTRAEVLAVTLSSYDSTNKVYLTTNAGSSWRNFTKKGLPNSPVNCALFYKTACLNMLIVGTDLGCYFTTEDTDAWQSLNTGLPNVIVRDMDVTGNILHAGTYGRGLWELTLPATAPVAEIQVSESVVCPNKPVRFVNQSAGGTGVLRWTFEGGTPASSELTSPVVRFEKGGTYSVKLVVSNSCATDSITIASAVRVHDVPQPKINLSQGTTKLSVEVPGTYQWYANGSPIQGATGSSYKPDVPGLFSIRVADPNGCDVLKDSILVDVVSVRSLRDQLGVQLYPLPANDEITIEVNNAEAMSLSLRILDLRSNEVLSLTDQSSHSQWKKTLSLKALAPGDYMLELQYNGRTERKSFVKVGN